MDLKDYIRKHRPHISETSVNRYYQTLTFIAKSIGFDSKDGDPDPAFFIKNYKKVLDHLKSKSISTRKTALSSIIVICPDGDCKEQFRKVMKKDIEAYEKTLNSQEKSEKQKKNWITQDEIHKVYQQLKEDTKRYWTKDKLKPFEFQQLQNFVILSLYVLIEPRRLNDYTLFKLNKIDDESDNYMKGDYFIFNTYKTMRKYGQQKVRIPSALKTIITKWKGINKSEYLIVSNNLKPLAVSQLNFRLNQIFGNRKISVNILRQSYLTEKYKNIPALKEIHETEQNMGNSFKTQLESYIKKD